MFISYYQLSIPVFPIEVKHVNVDTMIMNNGPIDDDHSGADAPYRFRHVVPSAASLADV